MSSLNDSQQEEKRSSGQNCQERSSTVSAN